MRLLLDTHTLLWWLLEDDRLSQSARQMMGDPGNDLVVSAASAWEISTKHRLGKLDVPDVLAIELARVIVDVGLQSLAISVAHAQLSGQLRADHRDPFDRILVAQSMIERLPLVTNDTALTQFDADLIL